MLTVLHCYNGYSSTSIFFAVLVRLGILSTNNKPYVAFNILTFALSHFLMYFFGFNEQNSSELGAGEFLPIGFNLTVDVMHWMHLSLKNLRLLDSLHLKHEEPQLMYH